MKRVVNIISNLTFWVLVAITVGAVIGHFAPNKAVELGVLGTSFIYVVKLFINPIIFCTITLGFVGMGDIKKLGRVGGKALLYFEIVTTIALLIGIVVAYIIQPGVGIIPANSDKVVEGLTQKAAEFSWWQFFKDNITIQVLVFSILLGILLNKFSNQYTIRFIEIIKIVSKYLFKALHIVMIMAPLGALGGMAVTIGKYGLASMIPLAKLMVTVYATMAIFIFVILWSILRYYSISIYQYLRYIREELLIVLGTSSSEAALPNLMEKLEKMGCQKSFVGLIVPSGYSFNLDGTTIYLSMATIFLAQVYDVSLNSSQILTIIFTLMITSKGAAGVAGSGFVVLASTLSAIQVIPLEGLALLLGVDRFMSEARAITNFIGNGVATIAICNNENEFDRERMEHAFTHLEETENILQDNFGIK